MQTQTQEVASKNNRVYLRQRVIGDRQVVGTQAGGEGSPVVGRVVVDRQVVGAQAGSEGTIRYQVK